jgi:chaperone modulatory protein CbpM
MNRKRYYQISEVAQTCHIHEAVIVEFIEKQWLTLEFPETRELDEEDLARAKLIQELQAEMGVNDDAIPIILHLLDQLHYLHLRLRQVPKKQT